MSGASAALTTELMWQATLATAAIDVPLVLLVAYRVPRARFAGLRWPLAIAAFLVYATLWGAFGAVLYWDTVYQAVFPAWSRWWLPLWFGSLFGAAALAFWRVSLTAGPRPAVSFVLLGGLASLVGHGIGIGRGLLRVPLLADVSATSALAFGFVEFVCYFCAIVGIATLLARSSDRRAT